MLVISNRKVKIEEGEVGDHKAFGNKPNSKGPNEVRLAHAEKGDDGWCVRLVEEPELAHDAPLEALPSFSEFQSLRQRLQNENKNCVFFVHGFNQSFEDSLERGLRIEQRYGVEAVVFSWPSSPGGFKTKEYRHAKRIARASTPALDATLEKVSYYLSGEAFDSDALENCDVKFSMMTYSLGNYLFQHYVSDAVYENETAVFENVVLCQADVDNKRHADWVDDIAVAKKVYVTINEDDYVLKWSDANFQKDRLGRTARNLNSLNATYYDFTDGPGVGKTHGLFHKDTNATVRTFFDDALNGRRISSLDQMSFNDRVNAFQFS